MTSEYSDEYAGTRSILKRSAPILRLIDFAIPSVRPPQLR